MATPAPQMNLNGLARRLVNDGLLSAEDAQKTSQIMLGVTASLWIYNMIDSYLFFPDQSGMKISAYQKKDIYGMSLNVKF